MNESVELDAVEHQIYELSEKLNALRKEATGVEVNNYSFEFEITFKKPIQNNNR